MYTDYSTVPPLCSEISDLVCAEVERRGGKPFVCGTPVVSDGETMASQAPSD